MVTEYLWNSVHTILGEPEFKRKLYCSVLCPPGKRLDFGCGSGHNVSAFLEFDYYGIEIDPVLI